MARYKILDVRCDVVEMMLDWVVGEVTLQNEETGEVFYLLEDEATYMVSFYRTTKSYFDEYFKTGEEVDSLPEELLDSQEFAVESSDEFFEALPDLDAETQLMYRYIFTISNLGWEDMEKLIAASKGRYIDEVELPKTAAEGDYEANREDDEDYEDEGESDEE